MCLVILCAIRSKTTGNTFTTRPRGGPISLSSQFTSSCWKYPWLYVLTTEQINISITQNCSKFKISDRFLIVSKGLPLVPVRGKIDYRRVTKGTSLYLLFSVRCSQAPLRNAKGRSQLLRYSAKIGHTPLVSVVILGAGYRGLVLWSLFTILASLLLMLFIVTD